LFLIGSVARANVTLEVFNNFASSKGATYFGGHVEDQDVFLYFTGIGATDVTYNGHMHVTAGERIQLSTVMNGSFTLTNSINAARVYAVLGSSAPATIPLPSGPSPVSVAYPYSLMEFSTSPGGKADQSFLNQVSFPTHLSNGIKSNSWASSATAQSIAMAFHAAFPAAPYAPASGAVEGSQTPYSPYAATTVTRTEGAQQTTIHGHRIIAASNVNLPGASPAPALLGTGYTNVPGFNNYLGWLQANQGEDGWKFGYNSAGFPDSTYVGYLKVTGTDGNHGLELSNFTYGGTFSPDGNITGGVGVTGTIHYAPNNSQQSVFGAEYTGNWTDMMIFSPNDPTGTALTITGDLGSLEVASVLYTVSASMGPGILGSDAYNTHLRNTNYFFESGFTAANALSQFFENSHFSGSSKVGFYDQYWHVMLAAGGISESTYAGYFTPYDDHFVGLDVLLASDSGTLTWQLGGDLNAVPEPSVLMLIGIVGPALGLIALRRHRRNAAA